MEQVDAEIIDIRKECFTQGQQYHDGKSQQQPAPFILECLHLESPYGPNNLSAVSTDHHWYWNVTFVNKRGDDLSIKQKQHA
jgi:hypothetical protein